MTYGTLFGQVVSNHYSLLKKREKRKKIVLSLIFRTSARQHFCGKFGRNIFLYFQAVLSFPCCS